MGIFKDDITPQAITLIHEFYNANPEQPALLRKCADVIEDLEANRYTPRLNVQWFVRDVYHDVVAKKLKVSDAGAAKLNALYQLALGGNHLADDGALPIIALGQALGGGH